MFRRFGFAALVAAIVLMMGAAVIGKSAFKAADASGSAMAAGAKKKKAGEAPTVIAAPVERRPFFRLVRAVGTAQANESIEITSKVADKISRMRFDSGDRVVKGQVLVELSSVEQYADLAESKATLEAARRNYERFQELAKRGFAATQRLEAARAAFESAQARTAGLQARIADRVIRAPFSGVIGLREASPGALAEVGMRLGTLDDTSRIKLDFDVAENQIAGLRPGASVIARTPAYPNETFTGVIANVNSRIDLNTRTLKARAILPNKNGRLKPGMLMSVEVRLNPRRSLAVPEMAVLERDTGTTLYVLEEAGGKTLAKLTDVVVGDRAEGWAEITTGVAEGQRIIAEGVHRVRPDQPVKVEQETARVPAGQAPPAEGGLRGPARAS